jgi:hypothetical protein
MKFRRLSSMVSAPALAVGGSGSGGGGKIGGRSAISGAERRGSMRVVTSIHRPHVGGGC